MPERVRASDAADADFQQFRQPIIINKTDSHTKWVVMVVGAGIITILGFLGARDRKSVDDDLAQIVSKGVQHDTMLASHESQLQVMKVRQEQMLRDLEAINIKLDKHGDKLDLMLFEIRGKGTTK